MSRSETITRPVGKLREQPHIIADRVQRRVGFNRLRVSMGLEPIPVTPSPEFPNLKAQEGRGA